MIDFVEYVVSELKSKKLSKNDALALIKQFSLRSSVGMKTFYIHPLLHSNTSDLSCQRYSTTLTGQEFFLKDHQVLDQRILPAVAYLEMARAAVENAIPGKSESTILELHNVVWVQPIVVEDQREISIALSSTDGVNADVKINFEIYSIDGEKEIVHCQGQAVFIQKTALPKIDIVHLKAQTTKGKLYASDIYPVFRKMGANFGPSHQGIKAIFQGDKQAVSELTLPAVVGASLQEYLLHPSMMDSALQSSIGLFGDMSRLDPQPSLPFALDTLRVISTCTREMFAWVRYSQGSQAGDKLEKLDVDLCDGEGNICVQMKGYCARLLSTDIITEKAQEKQNKQFGTLLATPVWQQSTENVPSSEKANLFIQQHIILCDIPNVNAAQLESLLINSKCHLLPIAKQQNISDRFSNYALACFEGLQSIIKSKHEGRVLVQIVVPDNQEESMFAGLNGLLQTATLENPNLLGQIIFINKQTAADKLAQQLLRDQNNPHDTIIQYKQNTRSVLRWDIIDENQTDPTIAFKDQGVYLITGGLGGLGVLFAKEILQKTSKSKIILTGRSSVADIKEKQSGLSELLAIRNDVEYRQLDIDNATEVKQFIAAILLEYKQLNGILHSAGMTADNFILKKTSSEFNQVLRPKVVGTFNLDLACQQTDLDFFVLFSSVASSFGNIGQADYAAANGFMDQFAAYRNNLIAAKRRTGKTLAINWPLWSDGGMRPDNDTQELLQKTTGMHPMKTGTGMQAFYRALELPYSQVLVLEGNLPQLTSLVADQKMYGETLTTWAAQQVVATKEDSEINTNNLSEETQAYLIKQFSLVLKMPSHKINAKEPLEKYGIDSILSMKLTNQLEMTFGSLPKTLFFEYQTIHELTGYFIKSFANTLATLFAGENNNVNSVKSEEAGPESIPQIQPKRISSKRFIHERPREMASTNAINAEPIAIVGLSGRYPEATNIQEYWNNLRNGKDCITEVPKQRWDWREYYSEDRDKSGHHYSKWGGFISGVDEFDPRFFNISPREAEFIDPQERLFLQHAWMAVEDAGYNRASLQIPHENGLAGQVGVYVGVMYSEYQLFGIEASMMGNRMSIPGSYASIANRVSYVLNLHGPSMTLDTMCSSSLAAIHLACQDLKLGRTSLAIAGGVNVSIHPNKYLFLSAGQFVSTEGHCQSFGEGGDGYIPGEGVGVVVLKKLSEAVRDGNHIYGVIKGSALNHGGKTNGYSVPNPNAQTSVISMALAESKIDPRHVSYIEAHGTGTKLGDPIEIAALSKAFQQQTQETGYCLLGSAKSNIGHCESAAGIAGLTKVLLQMKYQQIVPSLHSKILNPYIDFQKTPFVVNQTLTPWHRPVIDGQQLPRIAGISAFGAGGANAHLVVQEYIPHTEARQSTSVEPGAEIIFPLSARTADQLIQRAFDLLDFIHTSQPDLVAMAYTLQVGREIMEERVGFIASTIDQLAKRLEAYITGEQDIENVFQGQKKNNKGLLSSISADADFEETLNKWIAGKKLSKIVELWVNGFELDWNKFYTDVKPPRISLPTYPFAKEKYWISIKTVPEVTAEKTTAVLHPLLHTNTSSFNQQRYNSTFTGREFFLKDHQINLGSGAVEKMLSAATFLEMVRVAVGQASQIQQDLKVLELHNITWGQPAVVKENKQISIALFADENNQYEYEIFSEENEQENVHCVGQAIYSERSTSVKIDIADLKGQMRHGRRFDAEALYPTFSAMGLHYGSAHQGIVSVIKGENQLLAQLRLPAVVETNQTDFYLHPSLLDSALQASICLIADFNRNQNYPILPFALDSLSVVSPCTKEMFAWVRYAKSYPDNRGNKLDIDLLDLQGNICVQVKGLSLQQIATSNSVTLSSASVNNKPQTIQLNGSYQINAAVAAKPQAIQLIDVQDGDISFADRTSRPKTIQLSNSHKTPVGESTISTNSSQGVVAVTNNISDKVKSLSTVDVSLQSSTPSGGHSKSQLQEYLRTSLAEALYLNPSETDIDKSFVDLGLDSIIGVEWIKVINRKFHLEISATKVYDYSTIRAFASFLHKELENHASASKEVGAKELALSFSESSVTVN